MTKEQFIIELEHIAESGSNEIRLGNLYEQVVKSMFTKQQVEEACRKTLEKAAENATVEVVNTSFYADPTTSTSMTHPDGSEFHVYKPSITNSKNITIPQI